MDLRDRRSRKEQPEAKAPGVAEPADLPVDPDALGREGPATLGQRTVEVERKAPESLEEAYRLRDAAEDPCERDLYQEHVYRLRREEYRSRGVRIELSHRRRAGRGSVATEAGTGGGDGEQEEERAMRRVTTIVVAVLGIIAFIAVLLWAGITA